MMRTLSGAGGNGASPAYGSGASIGGVGLVLILT